MASASDVLPEPLCPMRAMLRMSADAIMPYALPTPARREKPRLPASRRNLSDPPAGTVGRTSDRALHRGALRYGGASGWMETLRLAISMILGMALPYAVLRWDRA